MSINFITGDATQPIGEGNKIICHICNDEKKWGAGFVLAISARWKEPQIQYKTWKKYVGGAVQFVQVEDDIMVANMIGQHGVRRSGGRPPVRYEWVEEALTKVAEKAREWSASIHMPRIGCGLAGGKWNRIQEKIDKCLSPDELDIYVYDFEE